jgi:cullin 1
MLVWLPLKLVGEGGANVESPDPKAYVDALLQVHQKNSDIVNRSFKGEAGFAASLDKACREFINHNAATGASSVGINNGGSVTRACAELGQ